MNAQTRFFKEPRVVLLDENEIHQDELEEISNAIFTVLRDAFILFNGSPNQQMHMRNFLMALDALITEALQMAEMTQRRNRDR